MFPVDRRGFFGLSALSVGSLFAADREIAPAPRALPSPYDCLFLTYSGDPTTSITIQWVGKPATLRYAPTFHALLFTEWTTSTPTAAPFPLTQLTRYRVNLTGLKPGTDYTFYVGEEPKAYRFRTMPAKATNSLTFVSGGDCGVNDHVVNNNKLAAKQDPFFAVIGGDLAYDNGTSAKTFLDWLRIYSTTMIDGMKRLIPMVPCLGNHEVNGGYGKTRKDAPFFFAMFDGLYRETGYATLDFGDYLSLVLLDSGHTSKIAGAQTNWLEQALKERVERPHLIAVNHVPCYPSFRPAEAPAGTPGKAGTGEEQRKHWVPLFEHYNVDLVLEHHDHTFKRTHPLKGGLKDKYGVLYLGDGSWGKLRSAAKAESRSYIATASTSYHMTVHRLEDEQRFHMALEEGGKIVDVCRTEKKPRKRG